MHQWSLNDREVIPLDSYYFRAEMKSLTPWSDLYTRAERLEANESKNLRTVARTVAGSCDRASTLSLQDRAKLTRVARQGRVNQR